MNQVAKKSEGSIAVLNSLEAHAGLGTDNISTEDTALPFLKVLTNNSPELETIDGAKVGMFYNTVSKKLYDGQKGVEVIPCYYEKKILEWAPKGTGTGVPIQHPITSDIRKRANIKKPGDWRDYFENGNYIEDAAHHYVFVVEDLSPAVIVMKSTQLKKSRKWNSMVLSLKMKNSKGKVFTPPIFSHVYRLASVKESNDKGSWYGYEVSKVGLVTNEQTLNLAVKFHKAIAGGQVEVKHTDTDGVASADSPKNTNDIF